MNAPSEYLSQAKRSLKIATKLFLSLIRSTMQRRKSMRLIFKEKINRIFGGIFKISTGSNKIKSLRISNLYNDIYSLEQQYTTISFEFLHEEYSYLLVYHQQQC